MDEEGERGDGAHQGLPEIEVCPERASDGAPDTPVPGEVLAVCI
jgi:hypothetical protein